MIMLTSLYIVLIALAEAVVALVGVIPGMILHALLIFSLLNLFLFRERSPHRRVYLVLALPSLLRLLSLTLPIKQIPQIYWYAMIGMPFLLALILVNHYVRFSWPSLKLNLHTLPIQLLIGLSGLPLGFFAYMILKPKPLASHPSWEFLLGGAVILILFSGFAEEILFRGMLQQVVSEVVGPAGILLVSLLYANMYLGSLSPVYILFVGLSGLAFAVWVQKTNSLWGVIVARSLWSIGLILVWPFILH